MWLELLYKILKYEFEIGSVEEPKRKKGLLCLYQKKTGESIQKINILTFKYDVRETDSMRNKYVRGRFGTMIGRTRWSSEMEWAYG